VFAHVGGEGGAHPRRCHGDGCLGRGQARGHEHEEHGKEERSLHAKGHNVRDFVEIRSQKEQEIVQCRVLTVPDVAVGHNPSITHRGEIPHAAGLPRPARPSAPSNVKISPHKLRDVFVVRVLNAQKRFSSV